MNKFLMIAAVMIFTVGCSQSGNSDPNAPAPAPSKPPQSNIGNNGNGTIVGNGGDHIPLNFTLFGLKSFEYWALKMNPIRQKYSDCATNLKSSEDPKKPWTEDEWKELLANTCGFEPQPKMSYFENIDKALKTTKLFVSKKTACTEENPCGKTWQSFPAENKIYISPDWDKLPKPEMISESLLAYDSLLKSQNKELIDQNLQTEIYKRVFEVDFSMDTFRDFTDQQGMKIIEEGSNTYSQEKIIKQMSLAMDCIRLIEKRFPNQMTIKEISLIESGKEISGDGFSLYPWVRYIDGGENDARVLFGFSPTQDPKTGQILYHSMDTQLFLGRNSNLQKCYNSIVSVGLKNPIVEATGSSLTEVPSLKLKPPMTGESELALEFINISFKALDYIVHDQRLAQERYKQCLEQNPDVGQQVCTSPLLQDSQIEQLLSDFPLIQVSETNQKLCTNSLPNCSDQESLAAINRPSEKAIVLNREKWKKLDVQDRIKLALHEVFGIASLELNDYHISSHFAPLIYTEEFNVDFMADKLRTFLTDRNILPYLVGDFYDHLHFQDRAILLMDCINLVEQRFPGRINIGLVSLHGPDRYSPDQLVIQENAALSSLDIEEYHMEKLGPESARMKLIGDHSLFIGTKTTIQQCYNKIVALGLKN